MSGRATEVAAITGLSLLLTVAIAAPVLRAPSERIFGKATVGRHHDPFTMMAQFRRPLAVLARGVYSQPLTDLPGGLLERTSGPVAGYNWLVLLTFPLSAAAAYVLARHIALAPPGAALVAMAFAFSPFHLAQAAYHPHIAQTQWVPLYVLALWRCLDASTPATVGLLAVSVVGVTLSNFYGGLIAALITPAAVAAYWFVKSRGTPSLPERSLGRLGITVASLAVLAACGMAYAWYVARPVLDNPAAFGVLRNDLFRYSANWWSYLVPPVASPVLGGFAARVWNAAGVHEGLLEQQVSLGWGLVALGLVAVVAWVRGLRTPRSVAFVPVLVTVATVAFVCSLAPERTIGPFTPVAPSALLYRVAPMFRSYARFGVVVQLMTALLAGVGAERLWRSDRRWARGACVALLAIAASEYAVWPPALWRDVLPTAAHRWVMRQPGLMNVLDCAPLTPESVSIQWLTHYRVSLQGGSFSDCSEPNVADKLAALGYTHLLVRRNSADERWFARQPAPTGLQVAARFSDGDVFAVTAAKPSVYTEQMTAFSSREYDENWTWRWMGPEASWTIVNSSDKRLVAAVDVEMTAFHGRHGLKVLLDGADVQTLLVADERGVSRVAPLALTPGRHALVFRPIDVPAIANEVIANGDQRRLSFAVGSWRWIVQDAGR